MSEKIYISANELLLDSYRLACNIILSGFNPDFIVGIWRGGTPVGIAVQEVFEYAGRPTEHSSIRTKSYYGIDKAHKDVKVYGLEYIINHVNHEDSLLIVDDVFDSGRSAQAVINLLEKSSRRNCPHDIRIATPWYKPSKNVTNITPDYYLHETEHWLVFPHELAGLSKKEIRQGKGDEVANMLESLPTPE